MNRTHNLWIAIVVDGLRDTDRKANSCHRPGLFSVVHNSSHSVTFSEHSVRSAKQVDCSERRTNPVPGAIFKTSLTASTLILCIQLIVLLLGYFEVDIALSSSLTSTLPTWVTLVSSSLLGIHKPPHRFQTDVPEIELAILT